MYQAHEDAVKFVPVSVIDLFIESRVKDSCVGCDVGGNERKGISPSGGVMRDCEPWICLMQRAVLVATWVSLWCFLLCFSSALALEKTSQWHWGYMDIDNLAQLNVS